MDTVDCNVRRKKCRKIPNASTLKGPSNSGSAFIKWSRACCTNTHKVWAAADSQDPLKVSSVGETVFYMFGEWICALPRRRSATQTCSQLPAQKSANLPFHWFNSSKKEIGDLHEQAHNTGELGLEFKLAWICFALSKGSPTVIWSGDKNMINREAIWWHQHLQHLVAQKMVGQLERQHYLTQWSVFHFPFSRKKRQIINITETIHATASIHSCCTDNLTLLA